MEGIDPEPGKGGEPNPKDDWPLQNLFFNYDMQRDFAKAEQVIDRALALNP